MQLRSRITTTAQGDLQIDTADHLRKALMDGLKDGLNKGGIDDDNALSRALSRSGALDRVKTPGVRRRAVASPSPAGRQGQ